MTDDLFVFLICQIDTESSIKHWFAERLPSAKFAFSRPGLLTYKLADDSIESLTAIAKLPLIRTFGRSLGSYSGDREGLAEWLKERPETRECRTWHLWRRDRARIGEFEFEPFSEPAWEMEAEWIAEKAGVQPAPRCNLPAGRGDRVLDLIGTDEGRWLIGTHTATGPVSCWVGGVPPLKRKEVISRAYYKLEETLRWTELPLRPGQVALELGSAPGGACQALLERGLKVIGVDPAEMDPKIMANRDFEHWKMRTRDLKKRRLANVDWLICDANLTPEQTLADIEPIATSSHVNLKGAVITLKMPSWTLFERLDQYVEQVRSWGWRQVRVRHRAFDRQELGLVAWN